MCPSFPSLPAVAELLADQSVIEVGAQTVHWEEKGAYTGQVSVNHIKPFARWCIAGHSEQRALTGETDELVQQKAQLLLKHGIVPVICIGETAEERAAEQTISKITQQMQSLLQKLTRPALTKTVIAYEPIWAISAVSGGVTPDPSDTAGVMLLIRKLITERFDAEVAERTRIIYGGSVTPNNVAAFVSEPGVDGVLVGGASTHPMHFVVIVRAVESFT